MESTAGTAGLGAHTCNPSTPEGAGLPKLSQTQADTHTVTCSGSEAQTTHLANQATEVVKGSLAPKPFNSFSKHWLAVNRKLLLTTNFCLQITYSLNEEHGQPNIANIY